MKNTSKIWLLFISTCLISCDCLITVDGIIKNKTSSEPISDVEISSLNKTYKIIKSNSKGEFHFSEINGGADRCSSIDLVFMKAGYKTDTISFKSGSRGVIVELVK